MALRYTKVNIAGSASAYSCLHQGHFVIYFRLTYWNLEEKQRNQLTNRVGVIV